MRWGLCVAESPSWFWRLPGRISSPTQPRVGVEHRPFHNPSARQYHKPLRWQQLLLIYLHALVQPLLGPYHKHFLPRHTLSAIGFLGFAGKRG